MSAVVFVTCNTDVTDKVPWFPVCGREWESSPSGVSTSPELCPLCNIFRRVGCSVPQTFRLKRGKFDVYSKVTIVMLVDYSPTDVWVIVWFTLINTLFVLFFQVHCNMLNKPSCFGLCGKSLHVLDDFLSPLMHDVYLSWSVCRVQSGSSVRVVNQLLTEMDGLEERKQVFIMAATNRPGIPHVYMAVAFFMS